MAIGPKELTVEYMYQQEIEKFAERMEDIIDKHLKSGNKGLYSWRDYIFDNELNSDIRDEIAKRYIKAGWEVVVHQTSSENKDLGEKVTYFAFLEAKDIPQFFETMTNIESYHIFGSEFFKYSTPCFFTKSSFDYNILKGRVK